MINKNVKISFVKGISTKIVERTDNLDILLSRIQSNNNATSDEIADAYINDAEKYEFFKKNLPAFIIGDFSERKDNLCTHYEPILVFDIDSIKDTFFTEMFIDACKSVPYILAAWSSPSRHGLRILVHTNSTLDIHKEVYESLLQDLSKCLNIPTDKQLRADKKEVKSMEHLDSSTSNVSRLWFYTPQPDNLFYFNQDATTFIYTAPTKESESEPVGNPKAIMQRYYDTPKTVEVNTKSIVEFCKRLVEKRRVPGGRNNLIFHLSKLMKEHGIDDETILSECLKYEEKDFTAREIKSTVTSAVKATYRKYEDAQIARYMMLEQGIEPKAKTSFQAPQSKKPVEENIEENDDDTDDEEARAAYAEKGRFIKLRNYLNSFYEFRRNVITFDIEMSKLGKNKWERLNENNLICELYEHGFQGIDSMLNAFLLADKYVRQYDPLKEYFDSLPPYQESEGDHIKNLCSFITADDKEFWESMMRKHLIRAVANAILEIPFNKHCLTLLGEQNDGKTSFVRYLCPPALTDYIKENPNLQNKDGVITIAQNFILNLDELDQYSKYDVAQLKSAMTLQSVKERMPYDKKPSEIRRRASFFASTNREEFLIDETGNIRWIVVKITNIKHDNGGKNGYCSIDINRVWAQAFYLLKQKHEYTLNFDEQLKINEKNKTHLVGSIEKELIETVIRPIGENEKDQVFYLNATDVLRVIENLTKTKITHIAVGKAMKVLGYTLVSKRDSKNNPVKRYAVVFTEQRYKMLYESIDGVKTDVAPY